jgi:hypothetical protein
LSVNDNRPYNFIAGSNVAIVEETLRILKRWDQSSLKEQLAKLTDEIIAQFLP